jgi:hypothetical protein
MEKYRVKQALERESTGVRAWKIIGWSMQALGHACTHHLGYFVSTIKLEVRHFGDDELSLRRIFIVIAGVCKFVVLIGPLLDPVLLCIFPCMIIVPGREHFPVHVIGGAFARIAHCQTIFARFVAVRVVWKLGKCQ